MVRLDCPLCGALVSDGDPPVPGACPGCAARYVGGTNRPQDAASEALAAWDAPGDAERLARALFAVEPDGGVALTSDRRDGFYAWWVFVADDDGARSRLRALAAGEV